MLKNPIFLFWVKEMVSVKERYEYAKRRDDLEFVAMIDLAAQHGLISMDDRWDVNEEEILNWWEKFKEDLEKQGKTIRYFYGEKTWVITEIGEKQPCDEAIAEVKEFLKDCGFQDVKYWKDTKQIDGILSKEITQGEVTYHIVVDFVEDKVLLEAHAETEEEYEDFQQETWQGLPDLYDTIIILMKHYGIFQGLPPKPKWKKLKLQLKS
jgi:hypothetical protein